jgi:hypothetical protein
MITHDRTQVSEIAKTLRLFVAPGDVGEVRAFKDRTPKGGFYFDATQIELAADLAAHFNAAAGVFLILNRIKSELNQRPRLTTVFSLTKDEDIAHRQRLLIDLDPLSAQRGADDASTDAEKETARLKMVEVDAWLCELGWPDPVVADSGNGWHLLFAIDLPNDEASHQLIINFLNALAKRFSDDHVKVDISVHNASRVTKCYGTFARKGEDRPERPHRLSKLVSVPDGMEVVAAERIVNATEAALAESTADGSLFDQPATAAPRNGNGNLVDFTLDKPKLILPSVFPVGGRHDTLLKVAGAVRSFGSNENEIAEILRVFNRTRCAGEKPDDELQKIARDYATKDVSLPMKMLVESGSDDQVDLAQRQQSLSLAIAMQQALQRLKDGRDFDDVLEFISTKVGTLAAEAKPQDFAALTSSELNAADLRVEYLVDDVLARGQPCVIAAAKKSLKTNCAIDLTLSLASGTPFLGKFFVPAAVRVALMSGESGDAVIQETARRIARSKLWSNLSDYANAVWSFELPRLGQPQTKRDLSKFIGDHALAVLIVDPAYLCLDLGDDAGNLFAVGKKLRELTEVGHETGCTIAIIHHNKKSVTDPFGAPELESIAWSGFQEWTRQWILLGRREAYNPEQAGSHKLWLSVGGSAGHSGLWALDIEEGSRKDHGGRRWEVNIQNASAAIAETIEQREETKAEREEQKKSARIEADSQKLLEAYRMFPTGDTGKSVRESIGMSGTRFAPANAKLLKSGAVEACRIKKHNREEDAFRLRDSHGGTGGTLVGHGGTVPPVPPCCAVVGLFPPLGESPTTAHAPKMNQPPSEIEDGESVPSFGGDEFDHMLAAAGA